MTNDKLRSVFLAALVVTSVFAGSVAFAGSAAAANYDDSGADARLQSGGTFWQGQTVWLSVANSDIDQNEINEDNEVVWELRSVESAGDSKEADQLITQVTLTQDESTGDWTTTVNTGDEDLDGDYVIVNDDGAVEFDGQGNAEVADGTDDPTVSSSEFEVTDQSFDATVDPVNVTAGDNTDLSFDSNRGSYRVVVSSDDLDYDELNTLLSNYDNTEGVDTNDDDENDAVEIRNNDRELTTSVGDTDVPTGNHSLTFTVADTDKTAEANLNVQEQGDAAYGFPNAYPEEQRGDIATINVSLENTDDNSAWVQIGSEEVNFEVQTQVVDENGDGYVELEFNTYKTITASEDDSGNPLPGYTASDMLSAAGDDRATNSRVTDGTGLQTPITDGEYALSLYDAEPVDSSGEDTDANEEAFGTLVLNQRSTDAAQTWTAPSSASMSDKEDVYDAVAQDDTVAMPGDQVIVQVEASGLYGYLDDSGNDITNNDNGLHLEVEQTNPSANSEPETIDNYKVIEDAGNNTFFVVINTQGLKDSIEEGQNFQATFTAENDDTEGGNYPLIASGESESVNTTFELVEPTVSFDDASNDGPLAVAQGNYNVTGETSYAPGTEIQVTARSTSANLLQSEKVTVDSDGSWSANFDFGDVDNGTEFTFINSKTDDEVSAVVDSSVQPDNGSDETPDETTTDNGTETTTTTPEETTDNGSETTTTSGPGETSMTEETTSETTDDSGSSGSIPGFGVSVSLVALVAAALLAFRRSN